MEPQFSENENQSDKPRLGWGLKLMLALFGVVILAILGLWAYTTRLDNEIIARQEQLRSQGYPVTFAELASWYPPIPLEDNAAPLLDQAFSRIQRANNQFESLPFVGTGETSYKNPVAPETIKVMADYMVLNSPVLDLLRQAASKKDYGRDYDFSQGIKLALDHLVDFRELSNILMLDALLQVESGQCAGAINDIKVQAFLIDCIKKEPFLIYSLIQIILQNQLCLNLEMILNRCDPRPAELQDLSILFASRIDPEHFTRSLMSEWPYSHYVLISGHDLETLGSPAFDKFKSVYGMVGLRQKDYLAWIDLFEKQLKNTKNCIIKDNAFVQLYDIEKEVRELPRTRLITRMGFSAFTRALSMYFQAAAAHRTALTALAVERYRREKGRLPEKLEDLVPGYLQKVPNDPFAGQPVNYVKREKGYRIYSVGDDRTDNGGKVEDATYGKFAGGTDICFTIEK